MKVCLIRINKNKTMTLILTILIIIIMMMIKNGIFQGDAPSPLLFIIALIPLTHILKTANPGYELRTGETINHLLFLDDLKLYSKSERALDPNIQTVKIFIKDIRMQFGIGKCVMLVMKNGKIVKSNDIQFTNDKVMESRRKREL